MRFNKPLVVGLIVLILWVIIAIMCIGQTQTITFTEWFPVQIFLTFGSMFVLGIFAGME